LVEAGAAARAGEWTVRNPVAGGLFAVQWRPPVDTADDKKPWRISAGSRLEMDVQLPPDAKLDLYATIKGTRHLVAVSGDQKPDARVRPLGAAVLTDAPDRWRHLTFELGAALKKQYPDKEEWELEELVMGALHGDEYRWLGFGGNGLGATYRVRDVRLNEAQ
jgi:hypothetical protein